MLRVSQCTAPAGSSSSWSILNSARKRIWSLENAGWITGISPNTVCNLSSPPEEIAVLQEFERRSYTLTHFLAAHFCINAWGSNVNVVTWAQRSEPAVTWSSLFLSNCSLVPTGTVCVERFAPSVLGVCMRRYGSAWALTLITGGIKSFLSRQLVTHLL